jgi:hypothetical protein
MAVDKSKVNSIISVDGLGPHSDNRLIGYSELLECTRETSCDTEIMDSEDPLFILYTLEQLAYQKELSMFTVALWLCLHSKRLILST